MYGGDETGGLVVDIGVSNSRFGWAGEDVPKAVFSSLVGMSASTGAAGEPAPVPGRAGARALRVGAAARMPRGGMEVKAPLDLGIVDDWEALEALWGHGLAQLRVGERCPHPLLVAEPAFSTAQQREKLAELLFESVQVPAMYLARAPVLAAFSMGRSSAVVVDIGASSTRTTPVHEGYVLTKGMHMSEVGGTMLSEALLCALVRGRHVSGEFPPRYAFRKVSRKGARGGSGAAAAASAAAAAAAAAASSSGDVDMASASGAGAGAAGPRLARALAGMDVYHADVPADLTRSYRVAAELEVVDDVKRSLCEVHETGYMEGVSAAPEARTYELPDGQTVKLAGLRHLIPELLFNADVADLLYSVDPADPFRPTLSPRDSFRHLLSTRATPAWLLHQHGAVSMRAVTEAGTSSQPIPLPKAVHGALLACAPEVRRDLCANVLLTGGGSNLRDLHKRMHWELSAVVPAAFKPRIVAPSPIEREFATWIGGSVLASLGTFQQMWLSKAEFEEEGMRVLEQKCQ